MSTMFKAYWPQTLILLFLFLTACFLFFYKLNSIPSGLYADEAVSGYNAYSLAITGRDEYGQPFPILLRFFGSYSPPLFTYSLIPLIKWFGLHVWVTRIISVFSGLSLIALIYFWLKPLSTHFNRWMPHLGIWVLIISPWLIFYSRVGYEVMLAATIFSWGTYWLWLGMDRHPYRLLGLSILSLSTYAAHTERYLVIILIPCVLVIFKKQLFTPSTKLWTIIGLILAALLQIPHLLLIRTSAFWSKSNLFYSQQINNYSHDHLNFLPEAISWPIGAVREFLSQWFAYFSPRSLFFLPDSDPQRSIPELSVFHDWMLIPYLIGLFSLLKCKNHLWAKYLILLLLLAPIPAAITGDPFSTQRALPIFLPLTTIITLGSAKLLTSLKRPWLQFLVIFVTSCWSLLWLWRGYFVLLPHQRAAAWGYGFDQLAGIIQNQPDTLFIIDSARTKPVYIYLAFFWPYPPDQLQPLTRAALNSSYYANPNFNSSYRFANVDIRPVNWTEDIYQSQVLIGDQLSISSEQAAEHYLKKLFEIRDPTNQLLFQGYTTNPLQKCLSDPRNRHCPAILKKPVT